MTIFDREAGEQLQASVENARVLCMADLVAGSFAGPCLDPRLLSVTWGETGPVGIEATDGRPQPVPPSWSTPGLMRRIAATLEALARPFDASARILIVGLFGFLAVLAVEMMVTTLAEGRSLVDAFYSAAKAAVTVGPNPAADQGRDSFKVFSAVAMILELGFAAVLTAGLVNRLLDPRLTGIVGRAAVPRRDHVIIVGLGQVGLRLAMLLRDLGVPVVVVERNPEAKNVARAKDHRLPVVIGSGGSHLLLRRLSIDSSRALAAVTSDDDENIAIAVAARGLNEKLRVALRAGDGEATSETRSLFKIGIIRDAYRIGGAALATATLAYDAQAAFPDDGTLYLILEDGRLVPFDSVHGPGASPPSQPREDVPQG